ncbi:MAG: DUF4815 domain-containing protein [Sediminibacterium sp.]
MTTTFNYDPYYDDFDEDKNFMRVLFRPGYSVQARELTQLQTILSNQIEKFGNHIFKSGSPITGGKISLDDRAFYLILESQYDNADIDASLFLNKIVVDYNSVKNVRAKVIAIDTSTNNPILILKYLSADKFSESDELKVYGQNIFAQAKNTNAVGRSYIASIQDGVYYFKGKFVKVVPQFLIVELFYKIGYDATTINTLPSYKLGIQFTEEIIDEIDDTSLLDPAQGAFNYQAPGATRYKLNTTLSKRTLDSTDESSFFEVIRLVNGVKTKEVDYPIYSEIEKTLARRTFEESGNYTVDPFVLSLEETAYNANNEIDPDYFTAVLDPGKAYVGGYEVQTIAPTKIQIPRARLVSNVSDYDLPTSYSSYVEVKDVYGTLNISQFPLLDVHCAVRNELNIDSTPEYNSTKIGTVRANMLKYVDATDSDVGTTHNFNMNLFEVNFEPITGTLASSGSSTTVIQLPATFSTDPSDNVYADMYFRVTDGAGLSLTPIKILESDSSARTITLTEALPFTPASNTFSIEADFSHAESFSILNGSIQFAANISDTSKNASGFSEITEPTRNSLIFDTPYESIKAGSISNLDILARKVYDDKVSNAGGVITINAVGTDTFPFAGSPGVLNDSQILNNIICFIREDSTSNSTSGISPNTILSLANSYFTVTAISSSSIEIDVDTAGVRADFIITTKINDAENNTNGAIRGKQLIPLSDTLHEKVIYELDSLNDNLGAANTGTITPVTGGYVFEDIGATFFDQYNTIKDLRTPGVSVSLQVPDVFEIVKIIDSRGNSNVTTAMISDSTYDITANYEFDNGQRTTHYDHASIKLKRGYSSPKGATILVLYKYFKHQSAPSPQNEGLFTVDSYLKTGSNFTYDNMAKFLDKENNKLVSMRSSLDFRPTRVIGGTSLSGAVNADPDATAEFSFDYYMSRIDKLVVKPSKEFATIYGKSDTNPIPPYHEPTDMLIYTLNIPAYTESVKDIKADFKNNRRFTMNDIGSFENRIKGLEYYVSLNSLEKNAADSKILDANGLERSKYGIVVDNFTDRQVQATYGQAGFDNRNLIENSTLKPASLMRTFKLKWSEANTTGSYAAVGVGDQKSLMLSYNSSTFAEQPYATKTIPVASALFANFKGVMRLFPEFSSDVETGYTAKVTLDTVSGLDTAFNFLNETFKWVSDQNPTWVNDKDNPFAKVVDSSWFETVTTVNNQTVNLGGNQWGNLQTTTDKVFIQQGAELNMNQFSTSSSQVDVGTFITDLSIQPYIKPVGITFNAKSLRPNAKYYPYFDGVEVDQYVVIPNNIQLTSGSSATESVFKAGEVAIVASTLEDLTTAYSAYNNGRTGFTAVMITNKEAGTLNIDVVNPNSIELAGKYIRGVDSRSIYTISGVNDHRSGVTRAIGTNSITLAGDAPTFDISGNTVTLVCSSTDEIGHGAVYTITSYNTTTKVATIAETTSATERSGSYIYSIGNNREDLNGLRANDAGDVSGIFYPPAATFRNGERILRLTESFNNSYDLDAISFAEKSFVSSGVKVNKTNLLNTVYNVDVGVKFVGNATTPLLQSTTSTSSITSTWRVDPLAQTFFVDPEVYPNGLFLESSKLFFSAKDDTLPVVVQIRPTVNGFPSSDFIYPESVTVKYPNDINLTSNPDLTDDTSYTKFTFNSPVFLQPGLYSLVILTDSPEYSVWLAEKGQTTTNNEYVGINPYIGTLYRSQNAMEYVPYLNEDLAFSLDRCVFSSSPATFSLQSETQSRPYYMDKFRILATSLNTLVEGPLNVNYSYISKPVNGSKETRYRSISPYTTYNLGRDEFYAVGSRRREIENYGDFTMALTISSSDNAITPLISLESIYLNAWENFIDNAEITEDDFNIIVSGAGYSNSNVVTVNSTTGTGAEIYLVTDGVNGNVVGINVASSGSGYYDDFTITLPLVGEGDITANAEIVLNSEYDSSGGPCLARYITKPITLADGFDASDIRVFLSGNKPGSSDIHVYYKVLSGSDITNFKDRPYVKMECFNPSTTPSLTDEDYLEYEYRPSLTSDEITYSSDSGTTFDTFKTFAIKIVLTSSDPAIIPKVRDLRVIALPAG